jgi:NADPH:quinone reductase-like Zn-dependent oxidoreductase
MKAILMRKYGSPKALQFEDAELPVIAPGKVLVKVHSSSVNPYDWHIVRGEPYLVRMGMGLRTPKSHSVGIDFSGTVTAVGEGESTYKVGDAVFGIGVGTFAEFALATSTRIALKPEGLSFESAATIPCAGITALQAVRDAGQLQSGQTVLVNGAAGGVGTFAVQIAKEMGATVTGVCSTRNLDLVRSIGADDVIDYTREDFSRRDEKFDVVVDTVGNRSLTALRRALKPKGTLVAAGGGKGKWIKPLSLFLKVMVVSRFVRQQHLRATMANVTTEDLGALAALVASGKVVPVVDRTYSLDEIPVALDYLEQGHARGKVVIAV